MQRCTQSFSIWRDGAPVAFVAGQLIDDKHPILKTHRHLFEEPQATHPGATPLRAVEQTTAEPGTVRTLTPPAVDSGPFNPGEHNAKEVLAYLDTASEAEALRVLDVEAAADSPRAGITKLREKALADARARDEQASAE
ncbi:hypothetical protein EDD93_3673 [Streptomyces sp. 840.1]|uniref:hypothetical protein n=1 Tax=Streptomyces sp. 840.1 TaxID=2485152 RepID=UPI000F45F791|nr:hypothetical protein [Streptomyces sp. 840.1]ROQ69176.1 hypothetical protein EDD93_3673 [Streptomyces sp. 840.1]